VVNLFCNFVHVYFAINNIKDTNQESERADKKGYNFTLNLKGIFSSAASELGCITVLGTGKVTPLYTTLKGICHGGFDF